MTREWERKGSLGLEGVRTKGKKEWEYGEVMRWDKENERGQDWEIIRKDSIEIKHWSYIKKDLCVTGEQMLVMQTPNQPKIRLSFKSWAN